MSNLENNNGQKIPNIDLELDKYAMKINLDISNVEQVYHAFLAGWEARDKIIRKNTTDKK